MAVNADDDRQYADADDDEFGGRSGLDITSSQSVFEGVTVSAFGEIIRSSSAVHTWAAATSTPISTNATFTGLAYVPR